MEDRHRHQSFADFPDESKFKPVHVLHIPDEDQFLDSKLVAHVRSATEPIIVAIYCRDSKSQNAKGQRLIQKNFDHQVAYQLIVSTEIVDGCHAFRLSQDRN